MSDLKRSRDTSPQSTTSTLNTSCSEEDAAAPKKKFRQKLDDTIPTSTKFYTTSEFDSRVRTAIDLNRAIKKAHDEPDMFPSIGYSPTTYEEQNPPSVKDRKILKNLRIIYRDVPLPYRNGSFTGLFHLTITRPNYKYDGKIGSRNPVKLSQIEEWFHHGVVAGYGDMESLETKVDTEVRDAREIVASEFTVDPKLIEVIRTTWAEGFIPGNVRVEPYKIQIYGEGGHFKPHRDTPEDGLVGTFLVGLGDSSSDYDYNPGNFCIGNQRFHSDTGSWVAFHPDVPHSVKKMKHFHYRAVLAFKIFRDGDPVEHEAATREAALQQRIGTTINQIPVPYGMLLEHKYHIGVQGLNGFDAIILSAAQQRKGTTIHVFPVLISSSSEVYYDSEGDEDHKNEFSAEVIPFTESHVDILLAIDDDTKEAAKAQIEFLEGVKKVPFYSRAFENATDRWQEEKEEINYTGNESDGERESSIYLSYALLVLPSPPRDS